MAISRFSYRSTFMMLCGLNLFLVAFILRGRLMLTLRSPPHTRGMSSAQLKHIWESEQIRRAMEPVDLIKRVKEIEAESSAGMEMSSQEDLKQTAAVDASKRLKDFRAGNDTNREKALEEWRKRMLDRARQRQVDKTGTGTGTRT